MRFFEALPELLRRHGVAHVFAMLGGSNVPWAAEGSRIGAFEVVRTRHEETSVHAATGYGRATGKIGVCTVTRGPGFVNGLNGLIAATLSHVPILMVVGESPTVNTYKEYTDQQVDQKGLAELVGAGFTHVSKADQLEPSFWEALRRAYWNGCPQVLSLNKEIEGDELALGEVIPSLDRNAPPEAASIELIVDAIERSQRPLILAGQGAVISGARNTLIELAELIGARLTTSLRAHRMFSGHPHDLGLCGSWSAPVVRDLLGQTDLVLAFGASLNIKTTDGDSIFGSAKIVHCEIDIDRPFMASSPDLALLGDANSCAEGLVAEWRRRGLPSRMVDGPSSPNAAERKASMLAPDVGHDPSRGLDLRVVAGILDEKLPEDRIIVTDSGRTVGTMVNLLDAKDAQSWLVGRGYGTVGLGIGTAVGAAVAKPDRRVALFCGDGGFMMGLSGLDVARDLDLNLTIVILNDQQLGSEMKFLRRFGLPLDIIKQSLPDIPALAKVFGGVGTVLKTESDIRELEVASSGLQLIDARLDPEVDGRDAYV